MAQQYVLDMMMNSSVILQGLVTREEILAAWDTVWQVIMLAVPEARGVPTLKDHLSFPVSAGFTE